MWTAGALKREFESILNYRIPASRREGAPYINTFVVVQKIWLRPNAVGQPTIMHNGGEGFKYGVRMIFHMGGKSTSSAKKLSATQGGKDYQFGVMTDIECVKNHVNGISFADGKIMVTSHGFMKMRDTVEEKKSREDYLKTNLEYIGSRLFGEKITDTSGIEFEVGEEDEN